MNKYMLDENKNVIPVDLMTWGKWFEDRNIDRHVLDEYIGKYRISTVFMGLDHNFFEDHKPRPVDYKPIVFETMIFDHKDSDIYCTRCSTWKEAEEMHQVAREWLLKLMHEKGESE